MAYIYLDDLQEILPVILIDWIEPGDEGWEWIFQEIEQKCYLGKKKKDKKKWKTKIESMVNTHSTVLAAQRNDINKLTKEIEELRNYATNNLSSRINSLSHDIVAAKSMAETAKRRTEVDYTKPIRVSYTLWSNAQQIIKVCGEHGATKEELEQLDLILSKYLGVTPRLVNNPEDKDCKTCKYYCDAETIMEPCCACDAYQCWEAKDDG